MKVFKFGGASVDSAERIKNVASILRSYQNEQLLIVISAMGKTTNALEKVVEAFYNGEKETALELFQVIRLQHLQRAKELLNTHYSGTEKKLSEFFTEVEWLLHDQPVRDYDYYYDQVVCIGELISTVIVSAFLNESGLSNNWLDVRDIVRTDDTFRDAGIDWEFTIRKVEKEVLPLFNDFQHLILQGFIGSTDENESTTLGREGSDYTAAVFANMLNAESLTIWKDVSGVMNSDPKVFPEAVLLSELSYEEVIEMAFYGAQVIHPKTIKPLQNKKLPLLVKSFLNPQLPGTIIHERSMHNIPPVIVIKENQALLHLRSSDFSFVGEKAVADLYHHFAAFKIKPNLIQTGAVSIHVCIDDQPEKNERLAGMVAGGFDVMLEKDLTLITIRHDNGKLLSDLTRGKKIELLQRSPETVQALIR